jgi:antitoxin MazE
MEIVMKVSKWGNSLAIRLPADMVEKLGVKEGDEIYAVPGMSEDAVTLKRQKTLDEMWARMDEIRKKHPAPAGFKFDRDEANSRGK